MSDDRSAAERLTELLGRTPPELLVVGCGNLLRGDDAVGPVFVRLLAERGVPDTVRLVDGGTAGMDVAFAMRGARRVVVVDASRLGVQPGTVHRVPGDQLVDLTPPAGNLHRLRWDQALGFAQWMLGSDYPEAVEVWLIEGASFEVGAALSAPVETAVEHLVDRWCEEWPMTLVEARDVG